MIAVFLMMTGKIQRGSLEVMAGPGIYGKLKERTEEETLRKRGWLA
jgi:hypothetical protein